MGKVPGLQKKFFGEESNEFTNGLERKVILRECPTEKKNGRASLQSPQW